jgi:nucleotide-binding universal stress UspA family protein
MLVIKKILLPTDGSENSEKAVESGLELASAIGASVVGVYVIDTSSFVSLPETFMWENVRELLDVEGKKALKYVETAAKSHNVKLKTLVKEGSPAKEIVDMISEGKIDLIIMGTAGRTGLDRFFLGSVSEKVLRSAPCSVMVVK